MALKLYNDTDIQDIANAIRDKNGSSDTYLVSEMAQAISDIGGGSLDETLLWENPNPNSNISSNIDTGISIEEIIQYEYIKVLFKRETSATKTLTNIYVSAELLYVPVTSYDKNGNNSICLFSGSYVRCIYGGVDLTSHLTINGNAYSYSGSSKSSTQCIPVSIYGVGKI